MHRPSKSQALAAELRGRIQRGDLVPGQRLPSHRVIAERLGVGRQVVLSACQLLINDGLLKSTVGFGTVVNPELVALSCCRIALVLMKESVSNESYGRIYRGLCDAVAGTGHHVSVHEVSEVSEVLSIDSDCLLLTGMLTTFLARKLEEHHRRYIVLGCYCRGFWLNQIDESPRPQVRALLMTDASHGKSVGVMTENSAFLTSREIIDEVERYSYEYGLSWGKDNVIVKNDRDYSDLIRRHWRHGEGVPGRVIGPAYLLLELSSILKELGLPLGDYPEMLVLSWKGDELAALESSCVTYHIQGDTRRLCELIVQTVIEYVTGRQREGFYGYYNSITKELAISSPCARGEATGVVM